MVIMSYTHILIIFLSPHNLLLFNFISSFKEVNPKDSKLCRVLKYYVIPTVTWTFCLCPRSEVLNQLKKGTARTQYFWDIYNGGGGGLWRKQTITEVNTPAHAHDKVSNFLWLGTLKKGEKWLLIQVPTRQLGQGTIKLFFFFSCNYYNGRLTQDPE